MEIGSAYALQVCLLQIPAMVAFSAWYDPSQMGKAADTFTCVIVSPTEQPLLILYQVDLPTLGRYCYHIVNLLINVYIHRGEGKLPPRKYPCLEVRLLCFI
jgi:Ca2+:H+ antiporter